MNKLLSSFVIGSAVAMVGSPLSAQAEQVPMDDPSWGYVIDGLGDSGREVAYVFTNTTAQMSWTAPLDVASAELLVVGGGGAGGAGDNPGWGNGGGGGGGAGGFRHIASQPVSPGQIYSVAVGAGAAAATQSASVEMKGGDSRFEDVVAHGGGSGGSGSDGYAGGSGGGGGSGHVKNKSFVAYAAGKTVDPTEGKDGGNSDAYGNANGGYGTGGGGGGASQAGIPAGKRGSDVDTDFGGEGGEGVVCDITGVDVVYSSGGGGGSVSGCDRPAVGGTGAGIGGGKDATNGGDAIGYGCGGGGGSTLGDMGGAGFQGIVVVRVNPTLNAWVEEPGLSATEWVVDQAPEDLSINFGRALHGEVTCNMTVDDMKALTMGDYDVVFTASADGYETIAKTNVVKVIAEAVEITLTNEDGSELDISTLSAGSVVKVNFTDNDNQDLVLSVAYGRYDKGEDFTEDADSQQLAAEEGRDYDPENHGGWDYFDPIGLIKAGTKTYTYTIPQNFGEVYKIDSWGADVPAQYQLLTDSIRFFLTPKEQTPMKYLKYISGTNPETQYINTGILPSECGQLVMIDVCKVSGGSGGFIVDTAKDNSPDPCLVYDISMTSAGVVKYNLRDSDKSPNPGTNSGLSPQCTLSATSNYRFQFQMDSSNNRLRVAAPTTASGSWDFKSARTTNLAKADATGPVVFHGASVSLQRLSSSAFYMQAAMGYNKNGELVPGLHDGDRHRFFASEGGTEFVAGPDDQYQKDQLKNVPVRGQTETMICHVHDWDMENVVVIEPATCTQKGNGQVACKTIGCPFPDARLDVELDAIGHVWGDWVVEKQPTCTEAGYRVRTCTREDCDHIGSPETNALAKIAHQRIFVKEEGGKLYYSCANCETEIVEDPAYGQIWGWLRSDGAGYVVTDCDPTAEGTRVVPSVVRWSNPSETCLHSSGNPLAFFAEYSAGKASKIATAKVRGFKVYEVDGNDETLVHDYVPATKSGKNAGLWDRVENKYWPATSAGFTAGKNQGLSITIR